MTPIIKSFDTARRPIPQKSAPNLRFQDLELGGEIQYV
jgi:hypothetical protein